MTLGAWGGGQGGSAVSVGVRALSVPDATQGVVLPVWVLYPTASAPKAMEIQGYPLELAEDAVPLASTSGRRRIVLVSHGNTGSPFSLRDVARDLAQAGFVVALVEHIGNSRSDKSLTGTIANLENRPRHLRLALDALLADPVLGPLVDGQTVGGLGLSIGAYTVLAAAGGRVVAGPYDQPVSPGRRLEVDHDPRMGPLVLLSPATAWLREPGSLARVRGPVFMRSGGMDTLTPAFHTQIVRQNLLPGRLVDDVVVPKAGHFSFLSPFPPAMVKPDFAPAHDPEGFDRARYAPILHGDVRGFFERTLRLAPAKRHARASLTTKSASRRAGRESLRADGYKSANGRVAPRRCGRTSTSSPAARSRSTKKSYVWTTPTPATASAIAPSTSPLTR